MTRLAIGILLLASVIATVWQGASAAAAHTEMLRAQERLAAVRADASEVLALRAAPAPAIAAGKRPEPGITGHISDTLIAAGLPVGSLTSLQPDADSPFVMESAPPGAAYRRQSVRITLEPLTLRSLGAFLAEWRQAHPEWSTASLQFTPLRGNEGRDQSIRVHLVIESTYLEQPELGEPPNPS
jgi:hypothetical protein